ncbi:MAG: DNA-binding protein [Candidatus Omnitrophica bacterium]|nr:DNA-binding protein [Candidatus Omnitrophota bacterium]
MKKIVVYVLCSMFYVLCLSAWAEIITSKDLIENAKMHDNSVVQFQGEVIGDIMARGDNVWVNIKDGTDAIGIYSKKDLIAKAVRYKGDYNYKGDILLVKGVFHRACPQHGGDLDIHIYEASKIMDGFKTPHEISFSKIVTAFSLALAAMGLAVLSAFRRNYGRKNKGS